MEALVHSMSKYATPLTELCDIISLAESNKSAQLCLDSDGLSIDSNRDGDLFIRSLVFFFCQGSKVNIIGYFQNLNKMLVPMTSELRNSFEGSLCLKSYTPALQEMREGLDAIAASYVSMETKLQEKLTQLQSSVDELVAALPDQPSAASLEASPMPSSDDNPISDMLKFTPDRGACRDLFKDKHRTEVAIDPKFFKTPEIDSPSTPVTKYERKQCDTPLSYSSVKSVARKPHNSDLRALTSSLVKKAKWNDVQRCSNKLGSANAKLFQPKPLLGPVESRPVNEDIFCLKVEDDDVTKSPSLLLASPSEEVEHKVSKPSSRRSSLEAIIQRYQKLRSGMSNDISKI
ncbi:hypothetical protein C0J52_05055 [Blattella germanica]|nr:hypothetical protein C0J52_05055 [Blattella germanica]